MRRRSYATASPPDKRLAAEGTTKKKGGFRSRYRGNRGIGRGMLCAAPMPLLAPMKDSLQGGGRRVLSLKKGFGSGIEALEVLEEVFILRVPSICSLSSFGFRVVIFYYSGPLIFFWKKKGSVAL